MPEFRADRKRRMRRSSAEDVWGSETTPHEALMTAHVTVPVSTLRECAAARASLDAHQEC